eukprot:SM000268S09729  [mRNA]  locus=s268:30143:31141:+ [translate_table: standard]
MHPDPVGEGLARRAYLEPAGEDCIVPGLAKPLRLLGLQVWPLAIPNPLSGKALEPLARELRTIGRLVDKAFNLMQAPLGGDR